MPNQIQNPKSPKHDLAERTAKFGEDIIAFCASLPNDSVIRSLISQLVRSRTSIGAKYKEADEAESKKDFQHKIGIFKIGICKKESEETRRWLRMVAKADCQKAERCRKLWHGSHELTLIFSAI